MTEPADDPSHRSGARRLTWLRRSVWVVLLAGVIAFLVQGSNNPPDPFLVPEESGAEAAFPPPSRRTDEVVSGSEGDDAGASTTASVPPAGSTTVPMPAEDPAPSSPSPSATPEPVPATTPTPAPAPTSTPAAPARRPLPGFGEVAFRITGPAGAVTDGVALLADDGASRRQGLMEQTDLRGYDAMVFRYPLPTDGGFYMRNTRIPLSIAFFDAGGRFVSSADMQPCPDDVEDCPSYFAKGPYVHAIEVAQGDLRRLGIGPGAILSFP